MATEQPCEMKSFNVALNIAEVEKIRLKILRSTMEVIRSGSKGALATVENCVLCG